MTGTLAQRVGELEGIVYNIDFACRACVHPQDAVRVIQDLCAAASIPAVTAGRKAHDPSES